MGKLTSEQFVNPQEIPDLVLPHMLLPVDRPTWHAVKESVSTKHTTTPVEVAFTAMSYDFVLTPPQEALLNVFADKEFGPTEIRNIFENNSSNHVTRVMFRAMFDPQRYAPIDLGRMYREESKCRGFNDSEARFFDKFVENWGVLDRSE